MGRSPCCQKEGLKKGPWTPEEDQKLISFIAEHGHGNWRALPKQSGLLRCGKSCRLRWANYLRPDIKRGKFSLTEEQKIIHLHALVGNKWAFIASQLPKRTDNEIKNYWNTVLKKRLQKMGLDTATHKPTSFESSSSLDTKLSLSTVNHLTQWESARLEAEARLAKESKMRAKGVWPGTSIIAKTPSLSRPDLAVLPISSTSSLFKPSTTALHLMNVSSNSEKSLQGQLGQLMWPNDFSTSASGAAKISRSCHSPHAETSIERGSPKSALCSLEESSSFMKHSSTGRLSWTELLQKEKPAESFSKGDQVRDGVKSESGNPVVLDNILQSAKTGEAITEDNGCSSFSDLQELLFGEDTGSCLSSHSSIWSQSSKDDPSMDFCGRVFEKVPELETITTSNNLIEELELVSKLCKAGTSRPHADIDAPTEYGAMNNRDGALLCDSMTEENSGHWNHLLTQLLDSPCSRPTGVSISGF